VTQETALPRSLRRDRLLLCNHTEGGLQENALSDSIMGCHGFFDRDGRRWDVSVDRHGIAWTWSRD